jgi:hypothetical protein
MPKRKNLNGLPHNLTKSYFGTLRYYGSGYMADWLLNAAIDLKVDTVSLDIINSTIDPREMEKLPLMYHLKDLKNILDNELIRNGFQTNFIVSAKIRVEIPEYNIDAKTLYCYPELTDIEGRQYKAGRIIETAYEQKFEPFAQRTLFSSLFSKAKGLFKFG